jgi:glycosyltransferase involved in cell wall biosynthesis
MSRRFALQMHRLAVSNPTGVHRYAIELAHALAATAAAGDSVELWSGSTGSRGEASDGVALRTWPVHRRLLHLSWMLAHRPYADRFTGPVALLHSLTPAVPVPTRAPFVVTIHDLLTLQHPQWYSPFARWTVGTSLRNAAQHAAHVITPTEVAARDAQDVLGIGRDRITVIAEGVDGRFSHPIDPATIAATCARFGLTADRFVVAVGEIGPRKNIPVLVEAIAAGDLKGPGPVLAVVGGDGSVAATVRALAERRGVADRIRWTGRVDDADLCALVQGARALAHPSLYEGFGLTPLEAMAAGTATAVSTAGSLPEVVGDAAVLIDPTDVAGWSMTLGRLLADEAWAGELAERGRRRAAGFSWPAAARQTWTVYGKLLGPGTEIAG